MPDLKSLDQLNERVPENVTLLDYFAAHALTGILANSAKIGTHPTFAHAANEAYNLANAMVEARSKF